MDNLSPEELVEAHRIAAIAKRAEEKAALRSLNEKREEKPKFLTKSQREALKQAKQNYQVKDEATKAKPSSERKNTSVVVQAPTINESTSASNQIIRKTGDRNKRKFKFGWDESDDTFSTLDSLVPITSNIIKPKRNKQTIEKELHWTEKKYEDMTERDWRIAREDNDIIVRGQRVTNPARTWDEMNLIPKVLSNIRNAGYVKPSPIQMQGIPISLTFRDIIGVAETGSGKTAAFAIPLICSLSKKPQILRDRCSEDGPLGVIMAPVRELVQQIAEEVTKLSEGTGLRIVVVVGGNSIQDQISKLSSGCEIVVATPGRLLDCLDHRYTVFNQVNFLVLDEADRMIDMGFQPQVEKVLNNMHSVEKSTDKLEVIKQEEQAARGEIIVRVTVMFSATMPPEVQNLAQTYMRYPIIVRIGDSESGKNSKITQRIFYLNSEAQKASKLLALVSETPAPIIVFVNSRRGCDTVGDILYEAGHKCVVLHGGKAQAVREASLAGFISGKYSILIATDVAGRGLDIDNVTHVINYEMALDIDRYCHRIGRTGRAGKSGLASTLLTENDSDIFYELVQYLKSTKMQIPRELAKHPKALVKPGVGTTGELEELE